jgi:protein TonB
MSGRGPFIVGSVVAHVALAIGLGRIEVKHSHAATAIEIADVPKHEKAKPPEPAKVDPVPPNPEHHPRARAAAAPKPAQNTPPKAVAAAADALPDFGLSLSGGVGGNGLAIPTGGGASPAGPAKVPAVRKALSSSPSSTASACDQPIVKPRPRNVPQPAYTAAARAAAVEGKVRVRLTVDETGRVVEVAVIQGLGYGLDEAAVAAARAAEFEPATECGKPVRATFTISMRFSAS